MDSDIEEELDGFSIPLRELTGEEATREITFDRFTDYMCTVGEDFVDQHESIVDYKVLAGWLLCKYPNYNREILETLNDKGWRGSTQGFLNMYVELFNEKDSRVEGEDKFYTDFAEFLNLTGAAKKRVNQILIQIDEHYNSDETL